MNKNWIVGGALALAAGAALAFPDKPVTIIVPNPAGGPVDVMVRVVANRLSNLWGQPIIIDNKPGGSGMLSVTQLAKAKPDGHTLGAVVASSVTIVPFTVDKFPIDPVKDLQPVMMLARTPFLFVVAQDSPYKTWDDFVRDSARREPTVGSWSIGSAFHLVWEQIAQQAGLKVLYAPSASSGKTLGDLVGGRLDIVLDAPSSARSLIEAGKIRPLAITSATRFAGLPKTPTLEELGLKGFSAQPWISLMAPAGTPPHLVAKIHQDVSTVLREPEIKARMEAMGMVVDGSGAALLARTIAQDRREMEPLVRKLDIRLQ